MRRSASTRRRANWCAVRQRARTARSTMRPARLSSPTTRTLRNPNLPVVHKDEQVFTGQLYKGAAVYLLRKKGRVVYVGMTGSIFFRVGSHLNDGVIDFDSFTFIAVINREEAAKLEAKLIYRLRPECNKHLLPPGPFNAFEKSMLRIVQPKSGRHAVSSHR